MSANISLIENHTDIDVDTVEWIHPRAFDAKANSDDKPMLDEATNGSHKEGFWSKCEKYINTLNNKHIWEAVE